jgi:hypothetical protein
MGAAKFFLVRGKAATRRIGAFLWVTHQLLLFEPSVVEIASEATLQIWMRK